MPHVLARDHAVAVEAVVTTASTHVEQVLASTGSSGVSQDVELFFRPALDKWRTLALKRRVGCLAGYDHGSV